MTRTGPISKPSKDISIMLFALDNYTVTPQAGLTTANILEGVLISKGFTVITAFNETANSLEERLEIAKEKGTRFIMLGGLSAWRYKTGIDGEPAVSLQLKLIDVQTALVTWSATASGHDWGNSTIGGVGQNIIDSMREYEYEYESE